MFNLHSTLYSLLSARTEDVSNLVEIRDFNFEFIYFFVINVIKPGKLSKRAGPVRIDHDENIFPCLPPTHPPTPLSPPAFTLFRQLLQQEPGQCWLSLRLRETLRPFISSRGAQIVFKTINTIARSETGGPIYPVAVLNAQDKTNDNTVCLLWPSPQALTAGLVPTVQRGSTQVLRHYARLSHFNWCQAGFCYC